MKVHTYVKHFLHTFIKIIFRSLQRKNTRIWSWILYFFYYYYSGHPASEPSNLADGGTCTYVCKQNKFCNVNFDANGPHSGRTKGLCFDYENRHDCEGTPIFCENCDSKCRGRVGATFSELVGPEQ